MLADNQIITFIMRPSLETLKKNKNLVGCEIGVAEGFNAKDILDNLDIKCLYLVDPYHYSRIDKSGVWNTPEEAENRRKAGEANLKPYKNIAWIRKKSSSVKKLPPLDFVYIDGDHTYNAVKSDIKKYYKFVKKGGLVAGHDYNEGKTDGVIPAVNEFVKKYNLDLNIKKESGRNRNDWWFIK